MNHLHTYILLFTFLFLAASGRAASQVDTISTVIVTNIEQNDTNIIEFDLGVIRNSEAWYAWANGTYQITIGNDVVIAPENQTLEYIGPSQLQVIPGNPAPLQLTGYIIKTAVLKGRLSIAILGPDEYTNAAAVAQDDTLILGKFKLTALNGKKFPDPVFIRFYRPYSPLQAHAFKKQADSISGGALWYAANDNVEMNSANTAVRYVVDNPTIRFTNDIDFLAVYRGAGKVDLTWKTTSEFYNRGFVIRRGLRSGTAEEILVFDTEVGTFLKGLNNSGFKDSSLISKSIKGRGAEYSFVDTVQERGEQYVYELTDISAADVAPGMHDRDTTAVIIPFSLVSAAEVGPNPFSSKTTTTFFLEGRANITIKITNLLGKDVIVLLKDVTMEAGQHSVDFIVDELASNGLYNIVIEATPVEEERNRGLSDQSIIIIPVQLIR